MANPGSVVRVPHSERPAADDAARSKRLMQKDKALIFVLFLAVVALGLGIRYLPPFEGGDASGVGAGGRSAPLKPLRPANVGQMRGFSLQLQTASAGHPYEELIDEIAATGANTIKLVVAAYQENCSSTSIFVEARRTPTDARLKKLIGHARRRGLRVVFMPIILLENPRAGEWRGKIKPDSWDDWWEDYNNYILHYAAVAEAGGAEIFIVGSELVSTEKDHADRWRALIGRVREAFNGHLSYSANWDHYRPITWWDAVDIVGMTTYYDLTGGKEPTVPRLSAAWKDIREDILAWQKQIGRPILFTEVGWPNQITCAQYPWDYTRNPDKPDPRAQANCFEAFFRTWIDEPVVAGFLVWEWKSRPNQYVGESDTGYVPCGKPAMKVIRKYYQYPGAAPATRPATRPDMPPATRPD